MNIIKGCNGCNNDSSDAVESDDQISDDGLNNPDFKWVKSQFSCNVDDIKAIIVGGVSSKFWQMRKYLNQIHPEEYLKKSKDIPFYAWQCITLQLQSEDIDLIIKKPRNMMKLVRFLIYSMNTVDGNRGSADMLCKSILQERLLM